MSEKPLKILFLAAEAVPFAKVGGLADVAGSLPQAIRALGHDVRLMIPRYGSIRSDTFEFRTLAPPFTVPAGRDQEHVHLLGAQMDEVPVYLIWNEVYLARDGVYGFEDDPQRFAIFGRAALAALRVLDWQPDVIHANDWHTGIVPTWLDTEGREEPFYQEMAALFTIHNLAYQGVSGRLILTFARMEYVKHLAVEQPGTVNWMAQGIAHADLINTVSRRYAQEILTPEMGMGLDPLLNERKEHLFGVLNGLDYERWNPATDAAIAHRFDVDHLDGRLINKTALQQQARLAVRPDAPLVGMVSRLDKVKGMELLEPVLEWLFSESEAQFILLGTGEPEYHEMFERLQARYPSRMRAFLKFDAVLARRIYAGADLFLMPSAIEPCGLGQMIAMRYGCVPVVRAVGGLADTVTDDTLRQGRGTGFSFDDFSAVACQDALRRALEAYRQPERWRRIQQRGMRMDFSWDASAREYVELYRKAVAERRRKR